jgi:subtilisin family serine protease
VSIQVSVGGAARDYSVDSIAIGAFGAMEQGVFVAASAGNSGPALQTVENNAPWITTVAASTLDRAFPANVILGNNQFILGQSLYSGKGLPNATELITGAAASSGNVTASILCLPGSLSPALAQGKILLCERGTNARVEKGAVVLAAGGAGMIIYNTAADEGVLADPHLLPATMVGDQEGGAILAYTDNGNTTPVASFQFLATEYNVKAPLIASFSSRGPNSVTPQVLKPDVTAPGVDIIAAWTGAAGPTNLAFDERRVGFNIISGTSMSCPHVSGVGALLRGAHPEWSPAAIKSAIMTTATIRDSTQVDVITDQYGLVAATPFQFGAGHVRPEMALDPGLVYDMGFQDYVDFLCASNYTADAIQVFTTTHNETVVCPQSPIRVEDLNYPSFAVVFQQPPSLEEISVNMTRTVTNVGNANATYAAQIVRPADTQISVYPEVLSFSAVNEKKTFTLQVTTVNAPSATLFNVSVTEFGYLVWTDGIRAVQSPISITVYK